ncbi:hypothetical protein M408DRAFT_145180 [Serendipita vermifera MAFF 305830]|uniref:Uncharacterized protein n=1 Tax=Serendipita vermifera MAFF 305830 TaxID=933852 RepID=A0A0C3B819_SERVB|nr:hypothetical protein M408DRAFT_145180 [Serendipita vermifera MAFF 305830]
MDKSFPTFRWMWLEIKLCEVCLVSVPWSGGCGRSVLWRRFRMEAGAKKGNSQISAFRARHVNSRNASLFLDSYHNHPRYSRYRSTNMSTTGAVRRPHAGRTRIRTISSIFSQTAKDVSGGAEQLSNLVTSVIIPATPLDPSEAKYDGRYGGMLSGQKQTRLRVATNSILSTIIQLFFVLSFAPVLLFAIFVVLTVALLTSGSITVALGAIIASGTVLAISLFTCVLPLSALMAFVLFIARSVVQVIRYAISRFKTTFF